MDIKGVFKVLVVFKRCVFVDTYLRQLGDRYITLSLKTVYKTERDKTSLLYKMQKVPSIVTL